MYDPVEKIEVSEIQTIIEIARIKGMITKEAKDHINAEINKYLDQQRNEYRNAGKFKTPYYKYGANLERK